MAPFVVRHVALLLLIYFEDVNGWRTFTINLTNSTSSVYSNKIGLNVTIKNNSMDNYFTVYEQLPHLYGHVEIFLQSPDSGRYDVELFNRTIDACKMFENSLYEPLIQLIYGIILEYGNFPKSCPIKPNKFYIKNMRLDAERFPPYLPERKGYCILNTLTKEKNVMTQLSKFTIHFEIKSSALNRFKGIRSQ